ncbi:MAG TPA: hypothetical protein VH684_23810 [Xanthobacteraceae bacterium]|jgi:hypothetical protein
MLVERLTLRSRYEPVEIMAWQAMAAVALVGLGGILRIYGARGDLWLDEIWSLVLLEPVKSFGQIMWGINSDNNHVLNSMYLYMIGPNAAPILLRGMSIALGIATVVAAGLILWRDGVLGALCAMLLFAVSYPVVHYGSEARGYSGLILFTLLALFFLQREFSRPSWINRQGFGLAIGLGLLSHLSMVIPAAAFGIWTLFVIWRRTAGLGKAAGNGFFILLPAFVWTIAIAGSVGYVALRYGFVVSVRSVPNKFAIGGLDPFDFTGAINALGELIRLTVGLPDSVPAAVCFVGVMALILVSAPVWRNRADRRFSLYVISVIILPTAVLAARVPNTQFPRYFLFSGIMFLLFIADLVTGAWLRGGLYRSAAALTLTAIVCGNAISLYHFFSQGRGHYSTAVSAMIESGWIVYGSDHDFRTPMVVNFYSHKRGIRADYIRIRDWCTNHPPDWYIVESPDDPILAYTLANLTFPRCALRFRRTETFSYWGLSGRQWVLYRRVN